MTNSYGPRKVDVDVYGVGVGEGDFYGDSGVDGVGGGTLNSVDKSLDVVRGAEYGRDAGRAGDMGRQAFDVVLGVCQCLEVGAPTDGLAGAFSAQFMEYLPVYAGSLDEAGIVADHAENPWVALVEDDMEEDLFCDCGHQE